MTRNIGAHNLCFANFRATIATRLRATKKDAMNERHKCRT